LILSAFSHVSVAAAAFGVLAVAAFWMAIQICWAASGKRWFSVVGRLAGAVLLVFFGILMVFYTAFGTGGN
jgi:hypothetical protein